MAMNKDLLKSIKQTIPERPITFTLRISNVADEYLWRNAAKHRIPAGVLAALVLEYAAHKDLDPVELLKEVKQA